MRSAGLGRHRDDRRDRGPARDRLLRRAAADRIASKTRDRLRSRIPEPDDALGVNEEDAVADVSKHALRLVALLPRDTAPGNRRGNCVGHREQRRDQAEANSHHAPAGDVGVTVYLRAWLQGDQFDAALVLREASGYDPVARAADEEVVGALERPGRLQE